MTDSILSYFSLEGYSIQDLTPNEKEELKVTDASLYSSDIWEYLNEVEAPQRIYFKGKYKEIAKELCFNELALSQENTKTVSWARVHSDANNFLNLVVKFLFEPDEIAISDIPHITYEQIKIAFEKSKKSNKDSHKISFTDVMDYWKKCSQLESISEEYRLNSSACKAITDHRSKRVAKVNEESGYKPFNYVEIEKLWNDINCRIDEGLKEKHQRNYLLRTACIIAILLITGMRIREMRSLKKGCCVETLDGNYELKLTRFKTSDNTIIGEEDTIPTTKLVFDACYLLESFQDEYTYNQNTDFLIPKLQPLHLESAPSLNIIKLGLSNHGELLDIPNCHAHRFRKSIAWLLISMDEENIALIRHLFGHKSYAMTLEYITRNHDLVDCIKEIYKGHYSETLNQIISKILEGKYSGKGAERIAEKFRSENAIKPQMISQKIDEIITIIIESGEPLFLQRTPIGVYCLTVPSVAGDPPPCLVGLPESERGNPKVRNCKWESCGGAICIPDEKSILKSNIEHNLKFYEKQFKAKNINIEAKKKYERKIKENKEHLANLRTDRSQQFNQLALEPS